MNEWFAARYCPGWYQLAWQIQHFLLSWIYCCRHFHRNVCSERAFCFFFFDNLELGCIKPYRRRSFIQRWRKQPMAVTARQTLLLLLLFIAAQRLVDSYSICEYTETGMRQSSETKRMAVDNIVSLREQVHAQRTCVSHEPLHDCARMYSPKQNMEHGMSNGQWAWMKWST